LIFYLLLKLFALSQHQILRDIFLFHSFMGLTREGILGRHEPRLCRHEPPRFAKQTESPLCRQCLHYAVNELPPYSSLFSILVFMCNEKCWKNGFWRSYIRILLKIRVIYWLSWLQIYMDSISGFYTKTLNNSYRRKEDIWRKISGVNLVYFVAIFDLNNTFFWKMPLCRKILKKLSFKLKTQVSKNLLYYTGTFWCVAHAHFCIPEARSA